MKQGDFIRVPREGFTTCPEHGMDMPLVLNIMFQSLCAGFCIRINRL